MVYGMLALALSLACEHPPHLQAHSFSTRLGVMALFTLRMLLYDSTKESTESLLASARRSCICWMYLVTCGREEGTAECGARQAAAPVAAISVGQASSQAGNMKA